MGIMNFVYFLRFLFLPCQTEKKNSEKGRKVQSLVNLTENTNCRRSQEINHKFPYNCQEKKTEKELMDTRESSYSIIQALSTSANLASSSRHGFVV